MLFSNALTHNKQSLSAHHKTTSRDCISSTTQYYMHCSIAFYHQLWIYSLFKNKYNEIVFDNEN